MPIRQDKLEYTVQFPGLPLAVYREIAVHLRQVEGVETHLNEQSSQQFDYNDSQIESLVITYSETARLESREQVERILAYYQNRYGIVKIDPRNSTEC